MQRSSSTSVTEFQQLWGSWTPLLDRLYDDPRVSQLMNTKTGQYLSSHPVLGLTVLLFGAIAALPVGLFLSFALVTIVMSAVGFFFFEGFLLFVGGLSLLCVLSGIAVFSVVASFIVYVFYITISSILKYNYPQQTKQDSPVERE